MAELNAKYKPERDDDDEDEEDVPQPPGPRARRPVSIRSNIVSCLCLLLLAVEIAQLNADNFNGYLFFLSGTEYEADRGLI